MQFNEKLRLLREAVGLTQAQLAERANLSRAAISLYESGARRVAYDDAPILAKALGIERSAFDRDELWAEYELVLAQAKAILLAATTDNADSPATDNAGSDPPNMAKKGPGEQGTIRKLPLRVAARGAGIQSFLDQFSQKPAMVGAR